MTATTADPVAEPEDEVGATRAGVVIGVLVVAAFVMILNETVVIVALRTLSGVFGVSAATVQWLTSGFLLTLGVVIPTTGYLLQRFTPRQIFLAATTLFTTGTLICGVAPGFEVLLVGRVVQACGTALIIPLLMTTVMVLVPVERRGSTMGTLSIVIAVAPALGPTLGGFVLTHLGWRWMFFCVLPLSVVVLILGLVLIRLRSETRSTPIDPLSVLLSALAFGGIVYGFSAIGEGGGPGVPPWVPLVVGAVLLVLFIVRQLRLQRRDRALLDMRPFTIGQFSVAAGLGALVFMSLLGAGAVLLPLFLQTVLHVSAETTGLAVLPGGLVLALLGRPVGAVFDRVGPRPLVVPGAVALAVSMWLLSILGSGPLIAVIGAHVLLMVGLGLMMTPLLTASLSVLPPQLYSHGSAIMTTLQQVAGAASTAGLVTIATVYSATPAQSPDATGLRIAFMVSGCLGILAVLLSLFMRGPRAAGTQPVEPPAGAQTTVPTEKAEPVIDDGRSGADQRSAAGDADTQTGVEPGSTPSDGSRVTVRGHVDTGGRAPAVVTLVDHNGRQHGHALSTDGGYEVAVPGTGAWYVIVSGPGSRPSADRVLITADSPTVVRHDVSLRPAGERANGDDTRPFRRPSTSSGRS